MKNRFKIGLAVILGTIAASLPIALSGSAAEQADEFQLTLQSQNSTTYTFSYPAQSGYGYLYFTKDTAASNWELVSRTNDATKTTIKFSKGAADYKVSTIVEGASGRYVQAPPPPVVPAPTNFRTTAQTQTSITVVWDSVTGATNYRVYRNNVMIGQGAGSNGGYSDAWQDNGLTCGTTYNYAVEAQKGTDTSNQSTLSASTSACSTADSQAPTAPSNVAVSNVTQNSADVSWNASTDNVGVDHYNMVRNGTVVGTDNTSPFSFTGLACNTGYILGVQAEDAAGNKSAVTGANMTTSSCSTGGNVVEVSGTITASALNTQLAAAPAGAVTVRPAAGQSSFTVSGAWTPARQNVTVQHANLTGTVNMRSGGSGLTIEDSTMRDMQIDGGNNWTIQRSVMDANCQVGQNFLYRSSGWKILNNTIKNFDLCVNPNGTHTEAFFIGAGANNGLIQGNTFDNNGSTGHLFFTWFDQGGSGSQNPHDICVTGNTFTRSKNGYFSIQFRSELPDTLNIRIDPNNQSDTTLFGNESGTHPAWVKACTAP